MSRESFPDDFSSADWVNKHYRGPSEFASLFQSLIEIRQILSRRYEALLVEGEETGLNPDLREIRIRLKGIQEAEILWLRAHEAIEQWHESSEAADDETSSSSAGSRLTAHLGKEEFAKKELDWLTKAIGSRTLGVEIMASLSDEGIDPNPHSTLDRARAAMDETIEEAEALRAEDPGAKKIWKATRFLKKTAIVSSGLFAIGVDVVSPDPTFITKAASCASGGAAILSQVPVRGE